MYTITCLTCRQVDQTISHDSAANVGVLKVEGGTEYVGNCAGCLNSAHTEAGLLHLWGKLPWKKFIKVRNAATGRKSTRRKKKTA